jgi:hypothetical protein
MDEKIKEIEERRSDDLRLLRENPYLIDERALQTIKDIATLLSHIKELVREKKLCEVCFQLLEPDGSCLTCRMTERVKELKAILAKIKSDPNIGKLEVEDWSESPDY